MNPVSQYSHFNTIPGSDTEQRLRKGLNQGGELGAAGNAALQVLSLRLPHVLGGTPLGPAALLNPQVGGGAPQGGSVLDTLRGQMGRGGMIPQPNQLPTAGPTGPAVLGSQFSAGPSGPGTFAPGGETSALAALLAGALNPPSPHFTPGQGPEAPQPLPPSPVPPVTAGPAPQIPGMPGPGQVPTSNTGGPIAGGSFRRFGG